MSYEIGLERGDVSFPEIEPLYHQHFTEMQDRLARDGITIGDYNPRWDEYFRAWRGGWLLNFVVRHNGAAVGYCNVYVTNDMHNGEKIAQEDAIYIAPAHRNGVGRKLVKHILGHLSEIGVKRVQISPVTDLRVAKIWRRMGFKDTAQIMTYNF